MRSRTTSPVPAGTPPTPGLHSPRRNPGRSQGRGRILGSPVGTAPRKNGSNACWASSGERPGPRSTTRTMTSFRVAVARTDTCSPAGENFTAFSSRLPSARRTWPASTRTGGTSAGIATSTRSLAGPRSSSAWLTSSSTVQSSSNGCAAPASSRERSRRSRTSRSSRAASTWIASTRSSRSSGSRRQLVTREAPCSRDDGGEGRLEIVADGPQDGRLDRVAPSERLGLERLLGESLSLDRDREERGQSGKEPPAHSEVAGRSLLQVQRPDVLLAGAKVVRRLSRRRLALRSELDPSMLGAEHLARLARRSRRARS